MTSRGNIVGLFGTMMVRPTIAKETRIIPPVFTIRILACWLALGFLFGCTAEPEKDEGKPPVFDRLSMEDMPNFSDDLDYRDLEIAVERSLAFYSRVPRDRTYSFGDEQVSVERLQESALQFLRLLRAGELSRESVAASFDVYRSRGDPDSGRVLVTGYYEPILEGRLEPDDIFCYPLYRMPADLLTVDLKLFNSKKFSDERLVGRLEGNKVVPYYTRAEIDGQNKLASSGGQLVWLRDPVAVFFLHIQGSGMIELPGGRFQRVGYAGVNGRPYRSIGKYLQDNGFIAPEGMSLQAIRSYLKEHPEKLDEVLWYNESYVFFRWVKDGPVGSLGEVVNPGRSIATDPSVYPRGGLAYLASEKPVLDGSGQVRGWEPFGRWVMNQDTGGAIRGPGRVDLFCGSGESAERVAGRLKNPGTLYFFVVKEKQDP